MINVLLKRSKTGMLLSCHAKGHAGYAKSGLDIVCSAVTVLIRTTMQVLSDSDGVILKTDVLEKGNISFQVTAEGLNKEQNAVLVYAGNFLEKGIASLQKEYPEYVELNRV